MNRAQRIQKERADLRLKPWEFSPSEVDDGSCPYPPDSVGAASWHKAQRMRQSIKAQRPDYFAED